MVRVNQVTKSLSHGLHVPICFISHRRRHYQIVPLNLNALLLRVYWCYEVTWYSRKLIWVDISYVVQSIYPEKHSITHMVWPMYHWLCRPIRHIYGWISASPRNQICRLTHHKISRCYIFALYCFGLFYQLLMRRGNPLIISPGVDLLGIYEAKYVSILSISALRKIRVKWISFNRSNAQQNYLVVHISWDVVYYRI